MKFGLSFLGIGAACALCCAPLLLPLIGVSGLVAAWAALSTDALLCGAILTGLLILAAAWLVVRRRKQVASCNCPVACQVNDGSSKISLGHCDL